MAGRQSAPPGRAGITTLGYALPRIADREVDTAIVIVGGDNAGRIAGPDGNSDFVLLAVIGIRDIGRVRRHADEVDIALGIALRQCGARHEQCPQHEDRQCVDATQSCHNSL